MSTLQPGQLFGRYTIINLVSSGDAVETYRAYDSAISRDVSLKVFTARAHAGSAFSERFQRGVVALLDLAHPHILDIHDAGEVDGAPYLAMPLVEGETVAQRLAQGNLTVEDVDRIVRQAGDALQYAHAHGITHGKLDLDNLLLDVRGNVLLSDIGLGSMLSDEALDGARRRDVMLLGGLALALLTGKAIVEHDAPLAQRLQPWIDRLPASVREAATSRIEAFLSRALAPQAADRFNTVADFLAAWSRVRDESGTPAGAVVSGGAAASAAAERDAARHAQVESRTQARLAEYERERGERLAAAERIAAEARVRVQRETDERAAALQRATQQRAAVLVDRARHETFSRLLRTINAVAAHRANLVGLSRPIARQLDSGDVERARRFITETIGASAVTSAGSDRRVAPSSRADRKGGDSRTVSSARTLLPPLIDLQKESARLHTPVRDAAAAGSVSLTRGLRSVVIGGALGIFLIFCVLPVACFSLLVAIPDVGDTPTPRPTPRQQITIVPPTSPPPIVPSTPVVQVGAPTATQRPTITPFVRPTNTAASPPATSVLIFTDTFQVGACRLPQSDTAQGTQLCADGEYRMLMRGGLPMVQTYQLSIGDAQIEVDARAIVARPSLEYGIVWRWSPGRYYGFTITPAGDAAVFDFENDQLTYWIKGLNTSAILKGSATNRLRVTVNGRRLTFAVNGRALPFTFNEDMPQDGQFGFVVISSESGAQVGFSRLNVWELRSVAAPSPLPIVVPTR